MSEHIDPLAQLVPLFDLLAERIVDKWLEKTDLRMVPQSVSPLGPRKHRAAVKRRIRNNEGGALIDQRGRRHLLTREALAEELRSGRKPPEPSPPVPQSPPSPPSPPTKSPDAAAYARDLLTRMQSLRTPKKA